LTSSEKHFRAFSQRLENELNQKTHNYLLKSFLKVDTAVLPSFLVKATKGSDVNFKLNQLNPKSIQKSSLTLLHKKPSITTIEISAKKL
jgi:hypothetical protein